MYKKTVIVVCGPTAVGKTSFAIRLAGHLKTEIISADSRQCYKELNIGVAKPSAHELLFIQHYFINSHHISEEVNAGIFENYALEAVNKILTNHATAVMVGGTGLYIKAFCEGMDSFPEVDPAIRALITSHFQEEGIGYLQNQIAEKDPAFWNVAERQNPQRLMRALEVILSTGKSITDFRKGKKEQRDFNIIKIGLERPRDQLYSQINTRVDQMMQQGLVEEVRQLLPQQHVNALQTVGYRELFDYFDGKISLQEATTNIKTNTRHYAKRQLTWFKKDTDITWYDAANEEAILSVLSSVATISNVD